MLRIALTTDPEAQRAGFLPRLTDSTKARRPGITRLPLAGGELSPRSALAGSRKCSADPRDPPRIRTHVPASEHLLSGALWFRICSARAAGTRQGSQSGKNAPPLGLLADDYYSTIYDIYKSSSWQLKKDVLK